MSTAENRKLDQKEIERIITADKASKRSDATKALEWPGEDNISLLAEAVKNREPVVTFDDGGEFTIRYDDHHLMVFIRPVNQQLFFPCGYFEYDKLRESHA